MGPLAAAVTTKKDTLTTTVIPLMRHDSIQSIRSRKLTLLSRFQATHNLNNVSFARNCGLVKLKIWETNPKRGHLHSLSTWTKVLRKLTVTQLVKKFPPFMKPEGSLKPSKNPPLVSFLCHMNPAQILPTRFFKTHLTGYYPPISA
jgi:hypothetical protein